MALSIESQISRDGEALLATKVGTVRRPSRTYPVGRICAATDCDTQLSIYNPDRRCSIHELAQPDDAQETDRAA